MNTRRFLVPVCILLLIVLLSGPLIVDYILMPAAGGIWFFIHTFGEIIDQHIVWGLLIFIVAVTFLVIMVRRADTISIQTSATVRNVYLESLSVKRAMFTGGLNDRYETMKLRHELLKILIASYASIKNGTPDYTAIDAFRNGEIPLPDTIHTFLFFQEKKIPWNDFRTLVYHLSGSACREFREEFEEVIEFLENYTEIKK